MGSESRNFLVQDTGFQIPGLAKLGAGHPKDFEWATLPFSGQHSAKDPPFAKNAKGRSTPATLPIHWATLEHNDEVERMEKEPFDIKKSESGITLLRIGLIYASMHRERCVNHSFTEQRSGALKASPSVRHDRASTDPTTRPAESPSAAQLGFQTEDLATFGTALEWQASAFIRGRYIYLHSCQDLDRVAVDQKGFVDALACCIDGRL